MTKALGNVALLVLTVLFWISVLTPPPKVAAQAQPVFESVTYAATSIGFSASGAVLLSNPQVAVCQGVLETAQIRIRYDGTAPTTTVGQPIDVGQVVTISGFDKMQLFRGIRTGATSGQIQWHCMR